MNEPTNTNISGFNQINKILDALKERHSNVVHDVKTTAGMKAAKADRAELKGYRVKIEELRVELKEPFLTAGRDIDAEAKRITGELTTLETAYDEQIKKQERAVAEAKRAEEDRKRAAEQAEREEALRVERQRAAAALAEAAEREAALKAQIAALEAAKPVTDAAFVDPQQQWSNPPESVFAGWDRIDGGDEIRATDVKRGEGGAPHTDPARGVAHVPAAHDAELLDLLDSEPMTTATGQQFINVTAQRSIGIQTPKPRELPTAQQVADALSAHAQKRTSIRNVCDVLDAIRAVWAQ